MDFKALILILKFNLKSLSKLQIKIGFIGGIPVRGRNLLLTNLAKL